MASDTDICNLALGFLGQTANVDSIDPPENSVEAEYCARFYPMARDQLLNMFQWNMATKRTSPAQIAVPPEAASMWQYAYIAPNDCLTVQRVYDPNASNDFTTTLPQPYDRSTSAYPQAFMDNGADLGMKVPQDFVCETDANGDQIIYTNMVNAAIIYTAQITDTTKYSPSFVIALAQLLASFLAGPVIKGSEGMKVAAAMLKSFAQPGGSLGVAMVSDAQARQVTMSATTPWMVNR